MGLGGGRAPLDALRAGVGEYWGGFLDARRLELLGLIKVRGRR